MPLGLTTEKLTSDLRLLVIASLTDACVFKWNAGFLLVLESLDLILPSLRML